MSEINIQDIDFFLMWEINEKRNNVKSKEDIQLLEDVYDRYSDHYGVFLELCGKIKDIQETKNERNLNKEDAEIYYKFLFSKKVHDKKVPRTLFKYTKIDCNLYKSLKSGYLWFSKFKDFNDPFEGIDAVNYENIKEPDLDEYSKETAKKFGKIINPENFTFDQKVSHLKNVIKESIDDLYVFSLTGKPKNTVMWGNYSNSFKGVCLELDPYEDIVLFNSLHKVKYVDDYPEKIDYLKKDVVEYFETLACTKSKDWKYENEYRSVKYKINENKQYFRKSVLKSIIFGCKTPEKDKQNIRKILSVKNGYNVEFKKVQTKENSFLLEIVADS